MKKLLAQTTIGVMTLSLGCYFAAAQVEVNGMQFNICTDKSTFVPGVPIYLNIVATNVTDHPLTIVYKDKWPPARAGKIVNDRFYFSEIVEAARLELQNPQGVEVIKNSDEDVSSEGTRQLESAIIREAPVEDVLDLEAHQAKLWRRQIPYILSRPGIYNFVYQMPKLEVLNAGKALPFNLNQKITVTVLDKSEIGIGVLADVALIPADNAQTGVPTLKWSIKPPLGGAILSKPKLQNGNCRLIIRNPQGELIREIFTRPYGFSNSGGSWTKPVDWEMPLTLGSFEGFQGNLFPKPGKYIVEVAYRDFLPTGGRKSYETDARSLWYSAQQLPPGPLIHINTEYQSSPTTAGVPKVGLWIDFAKTFNLEITGEQFDALKQFDALRK